MSTKDKQLLTSSDKGTSYPASNLVSVLQQNAKKYPEKIVYIFLEDGENEKEKISCSEIVERSKSIAAYLQKSGEKGDRVLLLFPTGIEFILSLYGCFFAGMIGVPAYPPKRNKPNERFSAILQNADPSIILCTYKIKDELEANYTQINLLEKKTILAFEDVLPEMAEDWVDPEINGENIALIQYTSGSTGNPNGVMVSHANIIHNSECIRLSFGFDASLVGVNWLPNFHDMGLIGCLIQPAYLGATNVIIPPLRFLQAPLNWFKIMTKYRATNAGGPNFAYEYCISKIDNSEIKNIDLSSVSTMFCGSEPIRKKTLENFAEKFSSSGFNECQFYPCYGLAESVLIVTGGDYKKAPAYLSVDVKALQKNKLILSTKKEESSIITACGYPWLGMTVVIVNPESAEPCGYGNIGEIWVKGTSVAKGYWNDPEGTERTFRAFIHNTEDGPYLRTGDLGFIHEGQLYISGRLKDLIIIRGSNYYPNDIEHCVEQCHPALRIDACAAFSADINGEEKLIIIQEVQRTFMRDLNEYEVFESIRNAVFSDYNLQPYAIILMKTGSISKTTSGKTQRYTMKKAWLRHELSELASWQMKPDKEKADPLIGYRPEFLREWMINWMAHKLEIDPGSIDPGKSVSSYGLDSVTAVSLERDINAQFGVDWPIESFLKENSINQLVKEGMDILRRREK